MYKMPFEEKEATSHKTKIRLTCII